MIRAISTIKYNSFRNRYYYSEGKKNFSKITSRKITCFNGNGLPPPNDPFWDFIMISSTFSLFCILYDAYKK
jgi:hypothetical protein